eukprot:gene17630-13373_t
MYLRLLLAACTSGAPTPQVLTVVNMAPTVAPAYGYGQRLNTAAFYKVVGGGTKCSPLSISSGLGALVATRDGAAGGCNVTLYGSVGPTPQLLELAPAASWPPPNTRPFANATWEHNGEATITNGLLTV